MKRLPVVALVVANLFVAAETVRHEWGYYETLLIFWCEALVIGGYNLLRLLVVGFACEAPFGETLSARIEMSPGFRIFATLVGTGFYAIKFGGFALAVGFLVVALPAFSVPEGAGGRQVLMGLKSAAPGVGWSTLVLLLSHGASFVVNFLRGGEYKRMPLFLLIFWPYMRMWLVLVVLAAGAVLMALFPGLVGATAFAVVMVLAKLLADLLSHTMEHAWIGRQEVRGPEVPPVVPHPAGTPAPPIVGR
ncbi:MAG TPA: DUF6498-containing protein [Candidatus Polarisedimenticolia bacterium]|nr:DUF6498-containing protein [Candidatus Polarisedimenticolia bacterium]